jgi:heme-degrading monooxygenase HmoA
MDLHTNAAGHQEVVASGSRRQPIVARTWTGRTRREVADEYLDYLYTEGVLAVERKPGVLGMQLFRKFEGDVAVFTTISYWRSMQDMEAMHDGGGDGDVRRVAHLEKDPDYLLELPEFAEVSELHANDWRLPSPA